MLSLIVLVGINLRTVLLAVPPVLPLLSRDLQLSYTQAGLLTSLPTLVMGVVSWPAGILIGRMGGRVMVTLGLALLILGACLRTLWPAIIPLYIFTTVLSLGVACSQIAIPSLIRQWFATRIGFAIALYTDGMVIGETLGAVLTVPVVLGWLGPNAWTSSFLFWSVPVVVVLLLWLWLAPADIRSVAGKVPQPVDGSSIISINIPVYINAWTLGLLLGGGQLIYFGMNAWIFSYNEVIQASNMSWLAVGMLNAAQLPVAFTTTLFADKLVGRRAPFIISGVICLGAVIGWVWTPAFLEPLWTALLGGASIFIYTLAIALPVVLARREDVALWTGIMMSVGYGLSFLGSFIGGWLWDRTQMPATAFLPLALATVFTIVLGFLFPARRY